MDVNDYLLAALTRERIDEMHTAARLAALRAAGGHPRPLRLVVGRLLVRVGNRLLADFAPAQAAA